MTTDGTQLARWIARALATLLIAIASSNPGTNSASAAVPAPTWPPKPGPRTAVVVLFRFESQPSRPPIATSSQMHQMMTTNQDSVRNLWLADSGGAVSLTTDVVETTLPARYGTGCNPDGSAEYFRPKYEKYDHILLLGPELSECNRPGQGEMPGQVSWYFWGPWSQALYHELGHNLGMHHGRGLRCNQGGRPTPIGGTCQAIEYSDPWDPMGSPQGLCAYNTWNRENVGWKVDSVTAPEQTRTISLRASDLPANGLPEVLKIPRTDDGFGTSLYVEWRVQDFATCTTGNPFEPPAPGLLIHAVPDVGAPSQFTNLLDMHPETEDFADAVLTVGNSFTDPASGTTITLTAMFGTTASVLVTPAGSPPPPGVVAAASGTVRYTARPGQTNDVFVTRAGPDYMIWEQVDITAGAGCAQVTTRIVKCAATGVTSIVVDLGDLDDMARGGASIPVTFNGGTGNDTFNAGSAANGPTTYRGGAGTDRVSYAFRRNPVIVKLDAAAKDGEAGERDLVGKDVEEVVGGAGNDVMRGTAKPQTFTGGEGNDRLVGKGGTDKLVGGGGNDIIEAKDGRRDIVDCGLGADTATIDVGLDVVTGC